jgi:cell wall-associated NlpC family hydrolase
MPTKSSTKTKNKATTQRCAPRTVASTILAPAPSRVFTRESLVVEADTWKGTPWIHQQSMKGVGADCLGFLRGMARFVGVSDLPFQDYMRISDENHAEKGWKMIRLLDENLLRLPDKYAARPGDWFAFTDELTKLPQHVAMVRKFEGGIYQVIHATLNHGVTFNRLDRRFMNRIHSAYQVPGTLS